ncbi:MAG TPA: uridylate kinase [Methanoregulaceae archaeon]|nr:uridylate kinase [Methanoregulaceae archaeon]
MEDCHVIKIGGSVFDIAENIIHAIISAGRPAIIIPGGGPFIGPTKKCGTGDEESHWMAIAGMEQYGWYLSSFGVPATDHLELLQNQSILLPYRIMRDEDPLPHTWDVSSDTIAAWLAWRLRQKLILVKSVDGIFIDGRLQSRVTVPVPSREVDPCLIPFVLGHKVPTFLVNGRKRKRLISFLNGVGVPGTVIGTTF